MHNYAAEIRIIREIRSLKIYLLCGSKLTMLIFVTTRQYSNEFGTTLAAPKIFHFSLFTFPLKLFSLLFPLSSLLFKLCIVHYALCIEKDCHYAIMSQKHGFLSKTDARI